MIPRKTLCQSSLFFAWLIAVTGLIVAQYSSDVLNMPVCHLCWYQRACIYPLVIILGIATFRNDGQIAIYALPLTLLGASFALFQYLEQMIPNFKPLFVCGQGPSCSGIHLKVFGFITFPLLSMVACIMISILLLIVHYNRD